MRDRRLGACTFSLAGAMLVVLTACQTAASGRGVGGQLLPPGYKAATRSFPECAAVRARAATLTDTTGLQAPLPSLLVPPEEQTPPSLYGKNVDIRVRVTERGNVVRDSIQVVGVGDHRYVTTLKEAVAKYRFWPAVYENCAVSASTSIHLEFLVPPKKL